MMSILYFQKFDNAKSYSTFTNDTYTYDIQLFLERLKNKLQHFLVYVGIHGSYARVDMSNTSDIDMTVVLKKVDDSSIYEIKSLLSDIPTISVYLLSEKDLEMRPISNNLQFFQGQKALYGKLKVKKPTASDLIENLLIVLEDVRHHYRYFFLKSDKYIGSEIFCKLAKLVFWWYQTYFYITENRYVNTLMQI